MVPPQPWDSKAEAKRNEILALIPEAWRIPAPLPSIDEQVDVTGAYIHQFLSEREIEITESSADEIVRRTATGRWKAVEVAKAFCHRAALAHQLLHCLHEIFFDAAVADAEKLDAYYATHNKPMGPLHGLPISLKDQFHVKGVETHMGYVGWIGTFEGRYNTGKDKVYESEMVTLLRSSGAILYCKTSVPHTLMSGETVNNIIGYTLNPKNRRLAAGGSSGGEGALIGVRGSPVGFGTDIGGSIRIPSAFNGLYGLRPSVGRLPYHGMANSMDGQNSILSVVGPIATTAASLRLVVKALLEKKPWLCDPGVHELPWRYEDEREILELTGMIGDAAKVGKLAFGVLRHDGLVNPMPPVRRAVDIVVKALQEKGHEVIPWTPPAHSAIRAATLKTWTLDAASDINRALSLSGEPLAPQISFFNSATHHYTASEIAAHNIEIRTLRKAHLDYWTSTAALTGTGRPVDAVISPVAPFPAARRERYRHYGYTTWANLLDYTAVVVPVTQVDKEIDTVDEPWDFVDEVDKAVYEDYDPEIYHAAHVGVQIVGRRLQEEKILALAEYVGKILGK